MNGNSLFESDITVSTLFIILAAIGAVVLIGGLIFIIVKLNRKLSSSRSQRYGFGGKTLYTLIALLAMIAVIPAALFIDSTDIRRSAKDERSISFTVVQRKENGQTIVFLSASPLVDNQVIEENFKIEWYIQGPDEIKVIEQNITKESVIEQNLKQGDYTIEISIETESGESFTKSEEFTVD